MSDIDQRQEQHERNMRDLSMIRDIMRVHEQKPLLEAWAFFVWGGITIAATLIHLSGAAGLTVEQALLRIWMPAMVVGSMAEAVAWFRCMRKHSGAGLSKRSFQLLLGFCGLAVVLISVILTLLAIDALSPAILLLLLSLPLLFYAQASFINLFTEAGLTVLIGLLLLLVDVAASTGYLVVGLTLGVSFVLTGVHSLLLERRHGE